MFARLKFVLPILVLCLSASAEDAPKITINANGTAKVMATSLEVILMLKAKGVDAKSAAAALKISRDKAVAKLADLGATAEQVKDDPLSAAEKNAAEVQRRQMMRGGGRMKRAKKEEEEEKSVVELQQLVHIRLPLKGKDATAIVIEAEDLKAKVVAAKPIEENKEAEADEGEEDNHMQQFYNQEMNNQGPVQFVFFAPSNEGAQNEALADALKKAKESAARMAKQLGKTAEIHSVIIQADGNSLMEQQYAMMYGYNRYGMPRGGASAPADGLTATTPIILLNTTIMAIFNLK